MHPTPSEQLQAIRHLIERAQADPELSEESDRLLGDAIRLLRRLERSWPKRMPFLVDDNQRAIRLLGELRPDLSPLAEEISAATERPPANGEEAADALNAQLQGLLARAVDVLADDPDGDRGRARISEHLRHRIAADPALNRHPVERPAIDP
ncbi:MAG: hypothetical protein WBM50_27695 [Acidimicrobiales bacterium]